MDRMEVWVAVALGSSATAAVAAITTFFTTYSELRRSRAKLDRIEHILVAPDQAWFWTLEWQAGESEADADLAAGRSSVDRSDEDFLAGLDRIPAVDQPSRAGR